MLALLFPVKSAAISRVHKFDFFFLNHVIFSHRAGALLDH